MSASFSPYLLKRARAVRPGTCVVCGCVDERACVGGCAWEPGSGERLCTAHNYVEKAQAFAALEAADAAPRRKAASR